MKPHELHAPEGARKARKRVGRGDGSGHGKTGGRGTKGTKARGRVKTFFEGGQMPLARRVPKLKGFKPPARKEYAAVNVGDLSAVDATDIGPEELRSAGLVRKRFRLIKLLAGGEVAKVGTVRVHAASDAARTKVEAAGGKIEILPERSEA